MWAGGRPAASNDRIVEKAAYFLTGFRRAFLDFLDFFLRDFEASLSNIAITIFSRAVIRAPMLPDFFFAILHSNLFGCSVADSHILSNVLSRTGSSMHRTGVATETSATLAHVK